MKKDRRKPITLLKFKWENKRKEDKMKQNKKGYFGIGIENVKTTTNIGTLWRSAYLMGADFIFTIGNRYKHQPSDTLKAPKNIPLFQYDDLTHFEDNLPDSCKVIGIELDSKAKLLHEYKHERCCIYLLGAEDYGLSKEALLLCDDLIQIEYPRPVASLNVSTAGSIIMYDRNSKRFKI